MSTRSLLVWVALIAGAELAVRGHLTDHGGACHGGALLFAVGLAGLAWPGRARRAGLAVAGLLAAAVAVDAGVAAWAGAPGAPVDPFGPDVRNPEDAPGETSPLARALAERFACPDGVVVLDVADPPAHWKRQLEASPYLALVHGRAPRLDELVEIGPDLRAALGEPLPPRASPGLAALEARWRERDADRHWRRVREATLPVDAHRSPIADRYRAALLAARRGGAEVTLLVSMPDEAEPADPAARADWLATRAHAQVVRSVAGAYGLRALEVGPELGALRERLSRPDAGCRERQSAASVGASDASGSAGLASGRIT